MIYTHCNTLQHTATHCNTLQHTALYCNTLQHTATHCANSFIYLILYARMQWYTHIRAGISAATTYSAYEMDGILMYNKDSLYTMGLSPMVLLWKVHIYVCFCQRALWKRRYSAKEPYTFAISNLISLYYGAKPHWFTVEGTYMCASKNTCFAVWLS